MFYEPRHIKKITVSLNQSFSESKRLVDQESEPAYIATDYYFVCNNRYSELLKKYGCPDNIMGALQLKNILNVINNADIDPLLIVGENIDFDLIMRIIDKIRFVSEDILSKAWSKILKNELENTSKYTVRTIDLLSRLSHDEAILFHKMSKSVFQTTDGTFYFFNDPHISGNSLLNVNILMEAGFVNSSGISIKNGVFFWDNHYILTEGETYGLKLTQFGSDIYQLMDKSWTIMDCKNELDLQKRILSWSIHKMLDEKHYDPCPILVKE